MRLHSPRLAPRGAAKRRLAAASVVAGEGDWRTAQSLMLSLVALVNQWRAVLRDLPEDWADVRVRLHVEDDGDCARAAALLGPANPGRYGKVVSFYAARRGGGPAPELIRRLLARLDRERIYAQLELVGVGETAAAAAAAHGRAPLTAQWDEAVEALPDDWSDLYCEIELASTDHLERGALLLAPVNPARFGGRPAFRFRVARTSGYGASGGMTRRCLERLDGETIRGSVRILRALSDTKHVYTQGPVWYVGGKAV